MNPSPSRRTQSVIPEEQSALLSSHEHDNTPEPGREPERGSSGPAWQVWRRLFQQSGEDGLPTLSTTKRQAKRRYDQALLYALLIFIGIGVGVVFGRRIERRSGGEGLGDGPLVVPIFEFPPPSGLPRNPAYLIKALTAAVASEEKTCSNLGVHILRDLNGTAVDAAITSTLCVGLLNAFSSGIGGGGFMTVRVPDGSFSGGSNITVIDFRETSPGKSEKEMYGANRAGRVAAEVGGLAIGVPGELRGLEMAHKMYGTVPWRDLVMPVAELARGWQISRELARRIRVFGTFMLDNPTWSEVYAKRGSLLVEGEYVKRVAYGRTLERVANEGVDAFYSGDIAQSMVDTVRSFGGILSMEDLANYRARSYPAIHQTYHGRTIYTSSAPSSGGVMLGLLNILEPYNITSMTPLDTHRLIEAMKFAFGARSEITDPAFAEDVTRFDEIYSKQWAEGIRPKITDNETHGVDYYGLLHDVPVDHGTTHLSMVDRWGGAVAITSTVNLIWGSHVMDPVTGVIFNDEMDDFSVPGAPDAFGLLPSPRNYPAPGKKPLSSTAPTIILNSDSSLYAVLGGSGGSRIFPSVAQVILNLESGLDISAAIERPRVHNQVVPTVTTIEVGPDGEDLVMNEDLKTRGHAIGVFDINLGVAEVQGILLENGTVWAASDSRKHGVAAGY